MKINKEQKKLKIKKINGIILLIILLIAAILRLWKLGSIPPSLTSDEASLGYNAYSILKTGRDEYGQFLPIIFKSFGDYKPGLYVYTAVPFIAVFGLNEWSVRLPSALVGIIAVWLIYKIIIEFSSKDGTQLPTTNYQLLAKIAALMLSISPWHIHFSRGAWEVNLALTLTLTGIYFFIKSLHKSSFLLLSSTFFSLTFLTYQGAKLSSLIVIFVLIVTFWKEIRGRLGSSRSILAGSLVVGLVIVSPILFSFIYGKTGRLEVFSVFSYPRKEVDIQKVLAQGGEKAGNLSYYLFHSENLNFARGIMGRWFNHFSGRFLFFEGDYQNPRHSVPNHGMLLLFDLILIPMGLISMIKRKTILSVFILFWLVLAPLPAVLSRDQVHAVRALNMVVPLTLISAIGLEYLWLKVARVEGVNRNTPDGWYRFAPVTLLILLGSSLIYYLDVYFVHLPKHNSKEWEYGYKQIVETVTPIQGDYVNIKVQQSFAQPYIYFLFYQKYDPAKYQEQALLVESEYKYDVGYIEKLDNICFCAIDFPQNKKEHGSLVVADDIRIPKTELNSDSVNLIKEISYLNGEIAFRIVVIE